MNKIILSMPTKFFTNTFLESIASNGLGITGDDLLLYLKEANKGGPLFSPEIVYSCKIVNDNAVLVGTDIN